MQYPFHEICSIMMQEPQCGSTAQPYSTTAVNDCEKNRAQPCYSKSHWQLVSISSIVKLLGCVYGTGDVASPPYYNNLNLDPMEKNGVEI